MKLNRRTALKATASATVLGSLSTTFTSSRVSADVASGCSRFDRINKMEIAKASSLLDANGGELTDESVIAVWAEVTAFQESASTSYSEDTQIPLIGNDGSVWGAGALLVQEDNGNDGGVRNEYGNEEFVLNAWDAEMGGSGTVLWDEGHQNGYALSDVPSFESYAENNGYTVTATKTLASDLSSADGAVVNVPGSSFTQSELDALSNFVSNGGALFLHNESGADPAPLNEIASALSLSFRFNQDDVDDDEQQDYQYNGPGEPAPVTNEFNVSTFSVFDDRPGLGLDDGVRYTATVNDVSDGDTVTVTADATGREYEVRILGMDTPETSRNAKYENIDDWEWIEDKDYVTNYGDKASNFAKDELSNQTVEIELDPLSDPWDPFGRLLAYVYYDRDGDGSRDTNWSELLTREGYARVYDAGGSKHDTLWSNEQDAQGNNTRVWTNHDGTSPEVRDRSVATVFQPYTSSIKTSGGAISASRVPVFAESEATQDLDANEGTAVDYASGSIPLVGVDEANNLAMVGGPMIDEDYDVSDLEHETFFTNLVDYLKGGSRSQSQLLIDGGHYQFKEPYALANEDCADYQRFLEGQGLLLEQTNDVTKSGRNALSEGRALIISSPKLCFTTAEADAVANFLGNGGSVILVGSGFASQQERENLNDLANYLGSDLRLNADQVLDDTNNIGSAEKLTTSNFNTADFSLFGEYS
ncbi:MAG: DUF4350 domain-containing protein [Halobaculum sp.]